MSVGKDRAIHTQRPLGNNHVTFWCDDHMQAFPLVLSAASEFWTNEVILVNAFMLVKSCVNNWDNRLPL